MNYYVTCPENIKGLIVSIKDGNVELIGYAENNYSEIISFTQEQMELWDALNFNPEDNTHKFEVIKHKYRQSESLQQLAKENIVNTFNTKIFHTRTLFMLRNFDDKFSPYGCLQYKNESNQHCETFYRFCRAMCYDNYICDLCMCLENSKELRQKFISGTLTKEQHRINVANKRIKYCLSMFTYFFTSIRDNITIRNYVNSKGNLLDRCYAKIMPQYEIVILLLNIKNYI